MQQRRGFTNKQRSIQSSPQKPELPSSEPPYEVIEFPSQQQYTNTASLRNIPKSSSERFAGKKCDLCGCSNAQFYCNICVQQIFCASCDQMYHRHPKRQMHIRKRIPQLVPKGMEPPLPPKNEFNQAPVPPPRRNKRISRTETPNVPHQGTIKKNGSLMGSLKRFMGGMQISTPQSTIHRNNAKSPNSIPHSSHSTDSDRQSGNRNFGWDWNADNRHRSGSFSAFKSPFPSLMQAQSMAQLNCPSCHLQSQSGWDWNRSQMNLNALSPWTGLATNNPWHGSIIIPQPYPMIPNEEFVRRGSFNCQRTNRKRRQHKFRAEDEDDSDLSLSDDRQSGRKNKSPHLARTASPALSRRSRRTAASESDDGTSQKTDLRFKRRTIPMSRDCSPVLSRRSYRKKYNDDDDTMSMKSAGSRRSIKSSRSYLRKKMQHSSSNDSDDELTSDKDTEVKMADSKPVATSTLQCQKSPENFSKMINIPIDSKENTITDLEDWECQHCTYLNSKHSKVCDVCCKSKTRKNSPSPLRNDEDGLETSMKNMKISIKNSSNDQKKKGNEKEEEITVKSVSTGTSPPPQTTSTQTYDIPQYSGKRNRSLSCDDYSDWNPAKKTNSILSSSSDKQSSSFQQDSSQSSEYIHALLQNHVKHGAEIVKLLKEAEQHQFELEDVTAALTLCGDENPIKWLLENWNKMIDTVVTLATNYGREQSENTIGTVSSVEAQAALRLHNGDIWASVTECIRQRQTKYTKLMSRGLYSREDVVTVLTANHGDLEAAYKELSKSQLRPFLMKIWGPPQGLDNDCGDISKLQYKDTAECEMDGTELPNDKENFSRIQSWLDNVATSSKEFEEFLDFDEVLNNMKKQPTPYNYNMSPSPLWDHCPHNFKTIQNENLIRYSSCDNLKMRFNNIPNKKTFYASTDILNVTKRGNESLRSQNFEKIKDCYYDGESLDFSDFNQKNELEQYLLRNDKFKRNSIKQSTKINDSKSELGLPVENDIRNYLNREFVRQKVRQFSYSTDQNGMNDDFFEKEKSIFTNNFKTSRNKSQPVDSVDYHDVATHKIQFAKKHKLENSNLDLLYPVKSHLGSIQNPLLTTSQEDLVSISKKFDVNEKISSSIEYKAFTNKPTGDVSKVENSLVEDTVSNYKGNIIKNSNKHEKSEKFSEDFPQHEEDLEKLENDFTTEKNEMLDSKILVSEYSKENVEILAETEKINNHKFKFTNQSNKIIVEESLVFKQEDPQIMDDTNSIALDNLHDAYEDVEKCNIPNMISLQSNSISENEMKQVSLCHEVKTQSENTMLLSELNALYWLAKSRLDFHVIGMNDTSTRASTISKIYINSTSENQTPSIIQNNSKQNFENKINETKTFSGIGTVSNKSNDDVGNKIRNSVPNLEFEKFVGLLENEITSNGSDTGTTNKKNKDFLSDEKKSNLANQSERINGGTTSMDRENGNRSTLSDMEKAEKVVNENEKTSSALNLVTINDETEDFLFREKAEKAILNQNENTKCNTDTATTEGNTEFLISYEQKIEEISQQRKIIQNTIDNNAKYEKSEYHPSLMEKFEIPINVYNETSNRSTADIITINEKNRQYSSNKETTEKFVINPSNNLFSSSAVNMNNEENDFSSVEEKENMEDNEESDISSTESQNGVKPTKKANESASFSKKQSQENKQISKGKFMNCENLTSDDLSFGENEFYEENGLQKCRIDLQLLSKPITVSVNYEDKLTDSTLEIKTNLKGTKNENKSDKNKNDLEVLKIAKYGDLNEIQKDMDISSKKPVLNEEKQLNKIQKIPASENEETQLSSGELILASTKFENRFISSENRSDNEFFEFNELQTQFQQIIITENEKKENAAMTNGGDTNGQNLIYKSEVEAEQFLEEGLVSTIDQAELVAQLIQLKFDRSQSIDAANECSNIHTAIVYLQQECHLCAEKFSMKQMISMLECEHKCCQECAKQFFALQISEKSIEHCVCPFCGEPNLSQLDSDEVLNYFSNLDILLKTISEPQTHELFQQKLRDRALMQDPNFKWCAKCSFGFIADLDQKRLSCPSCKAISCAACGKLWTKEHHGKSCEEYNIWLATQSDSNNQFDNYLEENGITCPKCDTKFILVKGGCMHLTCSHCKYEFCSDCFNQFSMGTDCKLSDYCAKLGLHAHHPRNCLFYLRDKEPGELKKLLLENNIEINLRQTNEKLCNVQLQRETDDGLKDMKCNAQVEEGGLCRTHYIEYLASLIRKNKIDPVTILDLTEILQEIRRQGKSLPIRRANSYEHEYRRQCIEIVKEEIPLK